MDGRSLCAYNMFIRQAYVDAVLALPWEDAAANREASWGSLKNILLHIVEVEDWWFHHVSAGRQDDWQDWDFERLDSAESVRSRMETIQRKTLAFLDGLDEAGLERLVSVTPPEGPPVTYRLDDILVHVAVEEVHHRGELIALLWQMDREPPPMTYLRWIRHKSGQE